MERPTWAVSLWGSRIINVIDWAKIILWTGGAGVLALAAFVTLTGLEQKPVPSLREQAARSAPPHHEEVTPDEPKPSGLDERATEPSDSTPAPLSAEKAEMYDTYRQTKADLKTAPTPNMDGPLESQFSNALGYARDLGQRVEVYQQTRNDLRKALTAQERARLRAEENPTPNEDDSNP